MAAEIGRVVQSCTAVSTLRNSASVVVNVNWTVVDTLVTVLPVVPDVQCQAVRDQSLVRELEYQTVSQKSAWLYANVSDTKNLVGDELVASAIKSAMAELGPNEVTNRTKIEPLAQQKLAESLNQKYGEGAVFINKVVINNMDFEEAYNTAIQQKSIAQQNTDKQKIENEAAIAKAEADKQVAITNAEAEAQKTSIAADAQAEANRKIAESLSDTLIEYQKIQKWDGKLPTVSGSNALVSIDPAE